MAEDGRVQTSGIQPIEWSPGTGMGRASAYGRAGVETGAERHAGHRRVDGAGHPVRSWIGIDRMSVLRGRVAVGLAVTLITAGCGGGVGPITTVRDSAGVTIVENRIPGDGPRVRPAGAALPWTVSPEPSLVIGAAEGQPYEQFFQIRGAAMVSDGRIAVANAGTREVRVFDSHGAFVGSVGREGDGPGEFRSLLLVGTLPGDSILVYDVSNRRFSVVSPEPAFSRSFRPGTEVGDGSLSPVGVLANGNFVTRGPSPLGGDMTSGTVLRRDRTVLVLDPRGQVKTVLDTVPGLTTFFESDGGFRFTVVPFTSSPPMATSPSQVHVGVETRYEIRTYDTDSGRLVRLIRLDRPARPVTEADIQRRTEAAVGVASSPEAGARLRRSYERIPIPEMMPYYREIRVDRSGYLWVEDYRADSEEPRVWTVFNPDGAVLGTVTVPHGLAVYEIGEDWILGVTRDDLDIPYVVVHSLERGDSEG